MTRVSVELERVTIALHGISAIVAEEAMVGLEAELRRRLGTLPLGDLAAFDAAELALPPLHARGRLDAPTLRGLIAERIVQALLSRRPAPDTEEKEG
jgi:hypothetical protein